jgi:hypothetical protein
MHAPARIPDAYPQLTTYTQLRDKGLSVTEVELPGFL